MEGQRKKKILIPIFNRAHYGRLRTVLKAIDSHPNLELQIIVSSLVAYDNFLINLLYSRPNSWREALPWYLRARWLNFFDRFNNNQFAQRDFLIKNINRDGFKITKRIPLFFDGGSNSSMAKAVGFGILKIVDVLKVLEPDMVFINADRFEMMAMALAASYLNIPIVHNEAGDVSGTIDESVRHAITKLAHVHFSSTEESRRRVLQMGENPETAFVVGSPAIDCLKNLDLSQRPKMFPELDLNQPFLLALFHPVTTEEISQNEQMTKNIITLVKETGMPTIFLGSNIDARSKELGLLMKDFRQQQPKNVFFAKRLHPDDFYRFLAKAVCAVGNSSSFIREGAYFGTPAVIVGSRQQSRERGRNVKEVGIDLSSIRQALKEQLSHGRYDADSLFGDGNSGKRIADILAATEVNIQKKFYNL